MNFPIARDSLAFGICGSEEQSPLNFTRFQVCEISNKLGNNLHSFDVIFMLHHKLQSRHAMFFCYFFPISIHLYLVPLSPTWSIAPEVTEIKNQREANL